MLNQILKSKINRKYKSIDKVTFGQREALFDVVGVDGLQEAVRQQIVGKNAKNVEQIIRVKTNPNGWIVAFYFSFINQYFTNRSSFMQNVQKIYNLIDQDEFIFIKPQHSTSYYDKKYTNSKIKRVIIQNMKDIYDGKYRSLGEIILKCQELSKIMLLFGESVLFYSGKIQNSGELVDMKIVMEVLFGYFDIVVDMDDNERVNIDSNGQISIYPFIKMSYMYIVIYNNNYKQKQYNNQQQKQKHQVSLSNNCQQQQQEQINNNNDSIRLSRLISIDSQPYYDIKLQLIENHGFISNNDNGYLKINNNKSTELNNFDDLTNSICNNNIHKYSICNNNIHQYNSSINTYHSKNNNINRHKFQNSSNNNKQNDYRQRNSVQFSFMNQSFNKQNHHQQQLKLLATKNLQKQRNSNQQQQRNSNKIILSTQNTQWTCTTNHNNNYINKNNSNITKRVLFKQQQQQSQIDKLFEKKSHLATTQKSIYDNLQEGQTPQDQYSFLDQNLPNTKRTNNTERKTIIFNREKQQQPSKVIENNNNNKQSLMNKWYQFIKQKKNKQQLISQSQQQSKQSKQIKSTSNLLLKQKLQQKLQQSSLKKILVHQHYQQPSSKLLIKQKPDFTKIKSSRKRKTHRQSSSSKQKQLTSLNVLKFINSQTNFTMKQEALSSSSLSNILSVHNLGNKMMSSSQFIMSTKPQRLSIHQQQQVSNTQKHNMKMSVDNENNKYMKQMKITQQFTDPLILQQIDQKNQHNIQLMIQKARKQRESFKYTVTKQRKTVK